MRGEQVRSVDGVCVLYNGTFYFNYESKVRVVTKQMSSDYFILITRHTLTTAHCRPNL